MRQTKSSTSTGINGESRLRLGICALGAILTVCLTALLFEFLFSLEATQSFFAESAFMISEAPKTPSSFVNEIN